MKAPRFWDKGGLFGHLLAPVSMIWAAGARRQRLSSRPVSVGAPVICVGNVVAGGAGKTPVAIDITRRLINLGHRPALLSRGYRGRIEGPVRVDRDVHIAADVGDEPLLLAEVADAWVSRDRVAGAKATVAAGADVIVMDDGLQHHRIAKTGSLLVIDGGQGFGNGRIIPAGPLREPVSDAAARVDAAVIIGDDGAHARAHLPPDLPVLRASVVANPDVAQDLKGRKVFAFAGIGRPEKVRRTLTDLGSDVVGWRAFGDHQTLYRGELEDMLEEAERLGAVPVTTAKDHVRLPTVFRPLVRRLDVALVWQAPDAVDALITRLVSRQTNR